MKNRDISLLCLLALCLSWGGFNLGRSFLGPKFGLDFTQYYVASRMVLEGEARNIYRTDSYYFAKAASYGAVTHAGGTMTNAYPPFVAFCLIPFALLPFRPALLLFSITGLLALGAGVWAFFADEDRMTRRDFTLAGLLITLSFFPVYYSFYMGQINALLFLCVALVLYFAQRGRPWCAGFFIALATLIKLFPAVLIVFFAVKRQFKPVAAAMVSLIVLGAVSLTVFQVSQYVSYFSQVLPREAEGGAYYRNQGMGGLFARLLSDNDYVNALGNWPTLARWLGALAGVFVLAGALYVVARRRAGRFAGDLEFGLCLVATMLALSKSWEVYGVFLLFAYFAILRLVAYAQAVPRAPLLLTFLSFCVWTFLLPQGTDYAELPRSILMQPLFSAKCLATAMLFVASVWFLRGSEQKTSRDDSQPLAEKSQL
ncbi:MAG: glycosyltransferase family 87 protein [Terriglobales bacterium]